MLLCLVPYARVDSRRPKVQNTVKVREFKNDSMYTRVETGSGHQGHVFV